MDYYCDVCDKSIKLMSKYKHFNSNTHEKFDECKHVELTIENPDIDDIDEVFYAYIFQHNKENDHFFTKSDFKLVLLIINIVLGLSVTYLKTKQWFFGKNI